MSKEKKYNFYKKNGYCIVNLFNKNDIYQIQKSIIKRLNSLTNKKVFDYKYKKLQKYNEVVTNDLLHSKLMKSDTRYIKLSKKIVKKFFNKEVLYILKNEWGHNHFSASWIGNALKKQFRINSTGFRIARPMRHVKNIDAAGPHVDVNAGGKIRNDFLAQVTMWIPIIGFSSKYTLRISPKSQKYFHNQKLIKGKRITLSFTKIYEKKFKFIRPNLKLGQALLLHSNLLHGSSVNNGTLSRVSLDTRILNMKRFVI